MILLFDGWGDDDDDDSWGNNDDDDGFTADVGDIDVDDMENDEKNDEMDIIMNNKKKSKKKGEMEWIEQTKNMDIFNDIGIDDDNDTSWKIRSACNKCISSIVNKINDTSKDYNPNMYRFEKIEIIKELVILLNQRICERIISVQISIFETYLMILTFLIRNFNNNKMDTKLDDTTLNTVCALLSNQKFLNDIFYENKPETYQNFYQVISNLIILLKLNSNKDNHNFIQNIVLPSIIKTINLYAEPKFNSAVVSAFNCSQQIYNNMDINLNENTTKLFDLSVDIIQKSNNDLIVVSCFKLLSSNLSKINPNHVQTLMNKCGGILSNSQNNSQNVINASALCLSDIYDYQINFECEIKMNVDGDSDADIDIDMSNKSNKIKLSKSKVYSDTLIYCNSLVNIEETRVAGIHLIRNSMECLKRLNVDNDKSFELCSKNLSKFLKQNSLEVRQLSLDSLVTIYELYPDLISYFTLSCADVIGLLKGTLSSTIIESYKQLKQFLILISQILNVNSKLYSNIESFIDTFLCPLIQICSHSHAIHPTLVHSWKKIFYLSGIKINHTVQSKENMNKYLNRHCS